MGDLFHTEPKPTPAGPVECLGMTFPNDEERRKYFLEKLREKLKDPEFRKIEGFPIGSDEDILALSDPPYYTACPNPFIEDFIRHYGKPYDPATDNYRRKPFAADVSEGKNDPIYNAHSYHTKVPHKAIMRYILHYTEPGDVVFDGFCGTGMTGVAAQLCGDKATVESLGYKVDQDGTIYQQETDENGKVVWKPFSKLGARRAILNDLSPAATFIAYNYNTPVDVEAFEREARRILKEVEEEFGWLYETLHTDGKSKGRINYTVWSDVFLCSQCQGEIVFWDVAVEQGEVKDIAFCPHCNAEVTKSNLDRAMTTKMDQALGKLVQKARQVPVLINYSIGKTKYEKAPDDDDLRLLGRIENVLVEDWYPTKRIDEDIDLWYERDYRALGIYSIDGFFIRRSLIMVAWFKRKMEAISARDRRLGGFLWFWFQSVLMGFSRLNRYLKNAFSQVNRILSGTLYVGAMQSEVSPWYSLEGKISRLSVFSAISRHFGAVSTSSAARAGLPDSSLDYIFVDPPFGSNIIYSDLSIIWESWLRLFTNTSEEAVVHRRKKSNAFTLKNYKEMMCKCFSSMYRALKPARWITVEFHNSKNSVWTAIQEALMRAGFVIADVRTLDKQMQTFKQVTAAGAVKQDLVISAYKPNDGLEGRFKLTAGTEDGVWDFVRTHLRQLPVFVSKNGRAEVIAERQNYLLFDRMVAFHVQRGVTVPLSAAEFYQGLAQRFPERDGMYFLPEQVAEYDKKRMTVREVLQLQLYVTDESSAIQWLRQQLAKKPQTFQELHPQFLKEIGGWHKHEKPLELLELLEQNFLRYDGKGEVPSQIHSYLSTNFKELRNLPKDDPTLRAKAKDRWYVPDPNKAGDLEKLRERALLREFEEYRISSQKRLKVFRLEAVRAGFKKAWQERDYATIIAVAGKIPENILQEDPKLLMWYDQAVTRAGEA
ncbi:MAG: DNA methyltransferase [Bacillota bacterium]